jgi:hypothetical protein
VNFLDKLTGFFAISAAFIAPWLLGATTRMGIQVLNFFGFSLGALFVVKRLWSINNKKNSGHIFHESFFGKGIWLTISGVGLILFYVLCSAINSRANLNYIYFPGSDRASGVEIDYLESILWLPHSYDANRTMRAFWKYASLACAFLAIRDWLLGGSWSKRLIGVTGGGFPSKRVEVFLWGISISSAALALVGMLQRLDGTDRLLWFFRNHINGGQGAFGPFPYQSNGAQFLNLMWPVMLGLWWVLRRRNQSERLLGRKFGGDSHLMALMFTVLVVAAVVLTQSKAGVLILAAQLAAIGFLLMVFTRQQLGGKLAFVLLLLSVLGVGGFLGGRALTSRFVNVDFGNLSGRKLIYEDALRMVDDFKMFGSGAETFAPLYYFYRNSNPIWDAYVHNDYLETLITFGWVGMMIIVFIFVSIWLMPFIGNGIPAPLEFIVLIGLAMVGMMAHARYDLPFQIYSLHFEFVVLCALLTCLKWERL